MNKSTKIGMIGLGLMGHGIAKNLAKAAYPLHFLDHVGNQNCADIIKSGATRHKLLKTLAEQADVVLLCVTGTPEVEALVYGEDGLIQNMRAGACLIDCSTAIPASTIAIAQAAQAQGIDYLDAPMTRTPKEAELGKLNLIVGGERAIYEVYLSLLAVFAENIAYAGQAGSGHKMKLLHNFVSLGFSAVLAEASVCAENAGIGTDVFIDVLAKGGGAGVIFDRMQPYIEKQDSSNFQFSLNNASKDMGYYCQLAKDVAAQNLTAVAVIEVYTKAAQTLGGDLPVPKLIDAMKNLA